MPEMHGVQVLLCSPDGPKISGDADAVDLVGEAMSIRAELIVVPVERFAEDFFKLSTRIAGEVIHRFVLYRLRLAIIGDISGHLETSSALRAFVYESNRGREVWFLADLAELDAWLVALAA